MIQGIAISTGDIEGSLRFVQDPPGLRERYPGSATRKNRSIIVFTCSGTSSW